MKCRKCGSQNPRGTKYCGYCQSELKEEKAAGKKAYIIMILILAFCISIVAMLLVDKRGSQKNNDASVGIPAATDKKHVHSWMDATCLMPRKCETCGETIGLKAGHQWENTSDESLKRCKICGKIKGSNKVGSVDDVIRERLPIATYAMTDADKVYSYSDSTLTRKTDWYYFYSRTNEIVILDISDDGQALYVRYPSTTSGTGYRDRWFAASDILGEFTLSISDFVADTKIKTYKRLGDSVDVDLIFYDMVAEGTKVVSLGEHIYDELIIYPLAESEYILDVAVSERMALTSPYDKMNGLALDGYKTFSQYLEYDYSYLKPARVLTKKWGDGGIKISFLSKRELIIKLKDSHMSSYPLTDNAVPLTKMNLFVEEDECTGIEIVFSEHNTLQHDEYFTDITGKQDQLWSFANVQFDYSDGYITMYLALPEGLSWDFYDTTSISVKTHLDAAVPKEYVVTQGKKPAEIHEDYVRKMQSEQYYFSALDPQGNVLWTHVTQERQDRGQMSGIKCIGYINDLFLYDDNDTIVALDAETGKQLWKRPDFEGVINACDVGMDGTLYFAGIYAPDLFIVSKDGILIKEVLELDGIDEKYPYVNKICAYDDYLIMGVAEYWDGWVQKYRIDLNDYSCTLLED